MNTVALLTDFGLRDGFAGVLKGVILSINPRAEVIDLSHDIEPFNILEGALVLKAHYSYFPSGTVFVCVVDPGVGTARNPLAVRCGDYYFVAPDNGILDLVIKDINLPPKAVVIENKKYLLPKRNKTFHGRDVFSPAGAYISKGVPLKELGSEWDYRFRLDFPEPHEGGESVRGQIVYFDRFGNAVTNIPCGAYSHGIFRGEKLGVFDNFLAGSREKPGFICGSFGFMEIFISTGNAREVLKLKKGEPLELFYR